MDRPAVNALLLDLDSTLLDNRDGQLPIRRTCEVIAALNPRLGAEQLYSANQEAWQTYFPEIAEPWMLGAIDGAEVSLEAWCRTLTLCDADDMALAQTARDAYFQLCRESYRMFEDAQPLLDAATGAGIPLALITNGASDTQRDKLDTLGIAARFDAIVISGEVRVAKPDPSIFAIALGKLGVGSAGVWHVGDSLSSDIAGARAAGLHSAWLNRDRVPSGPDGPRPDLEVASLTEILDVIAR